MGKLLAARFEFSFDSAAVLIMVLARALSGVSA